jgi:hypothetical protein
VDLNWSVRTASNHSAKPAPSSAAEPHLCNVEHSN